MRLIYMKAQSLRYVTLSRKCFSYINQLLFLCKCANPDLKNQLTFAAKTQRAQRNSIITNNRNLNKRVRPHNHLIYLTLSHPCCATAFQKISTYSSLRLCKQKKPALQKCKTGLSNPHPVKFSAILQKTYQPHECKPVPCGTEPGYLPQNNRSNQALVSEFLPAVHVRQMHLNRRSSHRRDCIAYRYAGMSIGSRIDYYPGKLSGSPLDFVHDLAFGIRLEK